MEIYALVLDLSFLVFLAHARLPTTVYSLPHIKIFREIQASVLLPRVQIYGQHRLMDEEEGFGDAKTESSVAYAPVLRIFPQILRDHEKLSIFMQIFSSIREKRSNKHKTDQVCFREAVMRMYPLLNSYDIDDRLVSKGKNKKGSSSGKSTDEKDKQLRSAQRRKAKEDGVVVARDAGEEKTIIDAEAKLAAGSLDQLLSHVEEGCTFEPFAIGELTENGFSQWQQDDNTMALVKEEQERALRKQKEVEKRRERKARRDARKLRASDSMNSFY